MDHIAGVSAEFPWVAPGVVAYDDKDVVLYQ